MRKAIFSAALAIAIAHGNGSFGAAPRFEMVSKHCFYLQSAEGRPNFSAVVTEDGILIIDPPSEPDLSIAVEALKSMTSKAVRWILFTNPRFSHASGARYFARHGAVFLASTRLHKLSTSASGVDSKEPAAPNSVTKDGSFDKPPDPAWFLFDRQMRLFPANLEIRIFALQRKARTGGDVFVFLPEEKVLFVGGLYESAHYPDIETAWEGSSIGWIDGLKQVVDSVPLLKSAIPQVKPEPKPEKEKTLEEGVTIISAYGKTSNLQDMKDLLDASQRLRKEISRAVRVGRTCEDFLSSPNSSPYRNYRNLDSFACQLFEDLSTRRHKNESSDSD